jgi:uncharacterized Zn-binding protein involved in type VI secretion
MHPIPDCPTSGTIMPRVGTVNIGFMVAAREGDKVVCLEGGQGAVLRGEPTVRIEGKPAARMGDPITHVRDPVTGLGVPCGEIEIGFPTVFIGSSPEVSGLLLAARDGAPFCDPYPEDAPGGEP